MFNVLNQKYPGLPYHKLADVMISYIEEATAEHYFEYV